MQGKKTKTGKRQGIGKKDKQINQEKKKKRNRDKVKRKEIIVEKTNDSIIINKSN